MGTHVLDTLKERGFLKQCTDEAGLRNLLARPGVRFYVGFDPTASSLHAGSLLPIMAMAHLQRAGHFPVAIVGGGTTRVGDPSGKTELRRLLDPADIDANGTAIAGQIRRYLRLDGVAGLALDNAAWLVPLHYIDFLRDIGRHFRVNDMLRAEAYRLRLEREEGLSFIEFNYQLLQAYDFLVLAREHDCLLQMGGDDQWGNIVAGADLIRRMDGRHAFGLTFPLLTTASGEKMGKTAAGAVWLDGDRLPPYDFFQYWINTDDRDVRRFLALFTFLPMDEVDRLGSLGGADLRKAKRVLALEVTRLCHGDDAAEQADAAARAAFSGAGDLTNVPTSQIDGTRLSEGIPLYELLADTGLAPSRREARRLISQGGASINGQPVAAEAVERSLTAEDLRDGAILLRAGKKRYHRLVVG